jgi:hypothetical protein
MGEGDPGCRHQTVVSPICCAAYVADGRFCCKSLFALVIKISFGCRRDFRVKMWGTSLREDKLAGDLGNVIEATSIRGRRSNFFTAGKLAPRHLGLLQQYRAHSVESLRCEGSDAIGAKRTCRERRKRVDMTKMTHSRQWAADFAVLHNRTSHSTMW